MKPSALNLFRRPTLRCVRCLMLVTGLVLAGSSGSRAQVLPKDPVEQFKEALLLERNWPTSYKSRMDADEDALKLALDFRKKNLTEKAAKLATLSELSRALLLIEWPKPVKPSDLRTYPLFDQSSFEIEGEVRKKMGDQFIKMVREATRKPANSADEVARLTATLDLVGETVASAGDLQDENLVLYRELEPLAKDIATLADAPSDEVRRYAAKALGQFPYNARVACAALEKLLTTENQETTRLAAATALASLVQSASSNQPIKGSEPNVSVREVRKSAKLFSLPEVVQLLRQVVKVAGIGMNDASPAVRRECAQAMRQSAETLTFQIKVLVPLSKQETSLPPKERAWSEDEKKMVEERREQDAENIETILSAMRAFKNQTDGFTRAVVDANPAVRLESRRALDSLVQCRELLEKLRKSVPFSSEIKPKKPAKKRQDVRSDVPSVPGFPVTARQEKKNEANPPDNQPEKRKEKNRKEDRDDD
ncbi:MAG: HEAT repeat domain-containing protein, partial [Gemmataceae bacterium]